MKVLALPHGALLLRSVSEEGLEASQAVLRETGGGGGRASGTCICIKDKSMIHDSSIINNDVPGAVPRWVQYVSSCNYKVKVHR